MEEGRGSTCGLVCVDFSVCLCVHKCVCVVWVDEKSFFVKVEDCNIAEI